MAKRWSYHAGEKGRNRVTVYSRKSGNLTLQWHVNGDRRHKSLGHTDRQKAKRQADEIAAELGKSQPNQEPARVEDLTLHQLFDIYRREVSPTKGESKQAHDDRASRTFLAFFDAQTEQSRRADRHPSTLDRTDWDRFIEWRRKGRIPGWAREVGPRTVRYDLKFLISVLNWARGQKKDGQLLLRENPWNRDVRASQNWEMPREPSPRRPTMTRDLREALVEHAPGWQFGAALRLQRETCRRNNAIRQLRWSDIDLDRETIRWRGEADKSERSNTTPLSPKALEVLRSLPSRAIGDVPVFPSASDPRRPTPRGTFQTWLKRAKKRLLDEIESPSERERMASKLHGLGFHAEKRAAVRDPGFRNLSPKVQEEFAGTNYETLRRVYDDVSPEDMRKEWRENAGSWG